MVAETWVDTIIARKKVFEQGWWKEAKDPMRLFDGCETQGEKDIPFNILYANTEILLPSLYSSTPRPEITVRPKGHPAVSEVFSKLLTHLLDDNIASGLESFDHCMEGAVLNALVPGAGGVRVRHYPGDPQPIRWEEYKYDQLIWGQARKWSKVPWIVFIHPMTKEEIKSEFQTSEEVLRKLPEDDAGSEKNTFEVYELWTKSDRKVRFLLEDAPDEELRNADDELGLAGFFPTPGPLTLVRKPQDLKPTPLYSYYKRQAEELNRVTARLERVTNAIRVRGFYNQQLGSDLTNLLSDSMTENGLVATTNPVDLQNGGLDKHIWMLPNKDLIQVAQQLDQRRQAVLQIIYQLTGLADIVRGSTAASESATAQSIKDKWGGLRLRRMQRTVEHYARDLLRLAAEVAIARLQPMELEELTGVKLPMLAQKQQIIAQYQQQVMAAEQAAQQAGQPAPRPPPPPELPPAWEELLEQAQSKKLGLMVDLETSSTLENEAKMDQKEVGEFLGPFSQLVQAIAPIAQMGPSGLNATKSLLGALLKRYKLGREVEKAFAAIQPPPPPPQPGQDPSKQAEMQMKQGELKAKAAELQQKAELSAKQHAYAMAECTRKEELAAAKYEADMAALRMKAVTSLTPRPGS